MSLLATGCTQSSRQKKNLVQVIGYDAVVQAASLTPVGTSIPETFTGDVWLWNRHVDGITAAANDTGMWTPILWSPTPCYGCISLCYSRAVCKTTQHHPLDLGSETCDKATRIDKAQNRVPSCRWSARMDTAHAVGEKRRHCLTEAASSMFEPRSRIYDSCAATTS